MTAALPGLRRRRWRRPRRRPGARPRWPAGRTLQRRVAARCTRGLGAARLLPGGDPPESFDLARGYAACFAAACALGLWLHNPGRAQGDPVRLEAVLDRLLAVWTDAVPGQHGTAAAAPRAPRTTSGSRCYERLLERLAEQYAAGELFSLLPLPDREATEGPP